MRNNMLFFQKIKISLSDDSDIQIKVIYTKYTVNILQNLRINFFCFINTLVKEYKRQKCLLTKEWISKLQ